MNINQLNSTARPRTLESINTNPQLNANAASSYGTRGHEPNLSPAAKLLGRNQAALRDALAPRPEVLKQYASAIHEPVKLHDRSIDRILHNMQSV